MEITPNSKLYILRDVPLDKTYDHTLYFASTGTSEQAKASDRATQASVFEAKAKYKLGIQGSPSALTYIRVNRGAIKVSINAERLYDCNYIMFKNDGFSPDRWFYAFITSVEYINNTTSQITYELDVMQTWYFDYTVEDCFVVREHSDSDLLGEHTLAEPLALGDYVSDSFERTGLFTDYVICMAKSANAIDVPATGGLYGNRLYHQIDLKTYECTPDGVLALKNDITALSIFANTNNVVNIFMCPRAMVQRPWQATKTFEITPPQRTLYYGKNTSSKYYYQPRNKKLLSYPYYFLRLNNMQGSQMDFKYERFNSPSVRFNGFADTTVSPTFVMLPEGYLQDSDAGQTTFTSNPIMPISVSNFPVCGWATNDLSAKIVQAGIGAATTAMAGVAGAAATSYLGYAEEAERHAFTAIKRGASQETINKYANTAGHYYDKMYAAKDTQKAISIADEIGQFISNEAGGGGGANFAPANAMFMGGYFDIAMSRVHITPEYAKIMDDYFDRYGYSCKRVKRPNTNARRHWTYTQTANCTITGSMPADDEEKICNIYNKGITFWKDPNKVGQYTTYADTNTPI